MPISRSGVEGLGGCEVVGYESMACHGTGQDVEKGSGGV